MSYQHTYAAVLSVPDDPMVRGFSFCNDAHIAAFAGRAKCCWYFVHLELPVSSPARSRYRATLRLLAENKTILEEDYLTPTNAGDNPAVTLYISGSLLKTNEYYEIILSTMDKNGRQKDSHTFTFYLDKK